mgnify:CR=1 FL=1
MKTIIESETPQDIAIEYIEKGLKFILLDLEELDSIKDLRAAFPSVLTAFAGIEFISKLIYGKGHHSDNVVKYFDKWMSRINPDYASKINSRHIGWILYDGLRCGLAHYGNVKAGIAVGSGKNHRKKHLSKTLFFGEETLFILGMQFASEFVNSIEYLKEAVRNTTELQSSIISNGKKLEIVLAENRIEEEKQEPTPSSSDHGYQLGEQKIETEGTSGWAKSK